MNNLNNSITSFRGDYFFLSNFYPTQVLFKDVIFPTSEHAYMSCKNNSSEWLKECTDPNNSPGQIKRLSRSIPLVSNWEEIKLDIMYEVLKCKFQDPTLATLLKETKDRTIMEGNNWGDTFWGVNAKTMNGDNHLGKLLMKIRDELLNSNE